MKNLANYKEFIFNAENQQELRNYYKQNTRIQQEIEREKYFRSLIKMNELLSIKSESLDFTDECAKAFKEISQSDLLKLQERLKKEIKAIKDMAIYQPPIVNTPFITQLSRRIFMPHFGTLAASVRSDY